MIDPQMWAEHKLVGNRPIDLGQVEDRGWMDFSGIRVLNLPIRLPHTGYRLPAYLKQFEPLLEVVKWHERYMGDSWFCYLTVDQKEVANGAFRRNGWHTDSVQGPRVDRRYHDRAYIFCQGDSTEFTTTVFDTTGWDVRRHDINRSGAQQIHDTFSFRERHCLYVDAFTWHRSPIVTRRHRRAFIRFVFSPFLFERDIETDNILFPTWRRYPRPVPKLEVAPWVPK